ncbi:HNH endonuclease [Desulfallas sp. Bu1-1]|uniref:RNA-guided endonuclease IscB n=1 Tax=Desulfallas sp. Bu1-1 TaxID=2787620 RepID=UPI00189C91F8|nr:RNA-guided endonuclease IscB [Desulfallas sp. Bu1-1]MBF7084394.1 HNH endonuclease [Desulfallas sp. Bu1-1]
MTYVYVLSKSGRPLMPTKPARARHLLKADEARVVRIVPFTIQLTIETSEAVQPVYAGQDPGLTQGVAAVRSDGKVLFQVEVKCRPDISEKLTERRNYRRNRRHRKTRYRQPRYLNRKKPEGWVAPSIRQLKHEHDKLRRLVEGILPVSGWAIELNKFDFQKMENPSIKGVQYQNGPQKGYFDVREYVLERDGYACVLCGSKINRKLYRFRGKSQRPKNLITLCGECYKKAVEKKIPFEVLLENYRWTARVNVMRALWKPAEHIKFVTAEQVAAFRENHGLTKTHANDALAAVCEAYGIELQPCDIHVLCGRYVRRKNRQLHRANPGKGGVRQPANANRYLINKSGVRFQKYDLVLYRTRSDRKIVGYINTLFSRRTVRIVDPTGRELYNGASINKLKKIQNADTLIWEVNNGVSSSE